MRRKHLQNKVDKAPGSDQPLDLTQHLNTGMRFAEWGPFAAILLRINLQGKTMNSAFARLSAVVLAIAGATSVTVAQAAAIPTAPITFTLDFNDLALQYSTVSTPGYGLGSVATSANIGSYLSNKLSTLTGTSATVSVVGALATKTYNGEGHVAGNTLGPDTFLLNNNFGLTPANGTATTTGGAKFDAFSLAFSNFHVTSIRFDYEIFPSATCQKGNLTCVSDFSFSTDKSLSVGTTPLWYKAVHSSSTQDAQAIGTTSLIDTDGAQKLIFSDWPAEIGIDNLVITGYCDPSENVPEPATLAMLGLGLVGVAGSRRRQRK
jgi:hypothetical protein